MTQEEKDFLSKFDSGYGFSEEDIGDITTEIFEVVDSKEIDQNRWSNTVQSILFIGERYFLVKWESGLTEFQEDYFPNQPIEVVKKQIQVTKTEIHWQPLCEQAKKPEDRS